MIEILLEILLSGLIEGLLEALVEVALEVLVLKVSNPSWELFRTGVRGGAVLLLGGIAGSLFTLAAPKPFLPASPVPGASLILSPLLAGVIMWRFGAWRRSRGSSTSCLSTFWGGALFAFGLSLARFCLVQ
ncbi:MAG TPA: hypothetical protein VFY29_09435 [Terriglobia bacterium]|nr:hypothetical protein [Terriglobia bacterium]